MLVTQIATSATAVIMAMAANDAQPEPWWQADWTHRRIIESKGEWCRIPYDPITAKGRLALQPELSRLPHWAQTVEMTEARAVAADPEVHYSFPRLVRTADSRLLLFYRVGLSHASDPAAIAMRKSFDDGKTWSGERIIHRDPDGYCAHNPVAVVASDGRIILFASILPTGPESFMVLLRDRRRQSTWRVWTTDEGRTWSEPEDIGSQVEILQRPYLTRLTQSLLLLSGRDRKRALIVVYVSRDGGKTFAERHAIDRFYGDGGYTAGVPLSDSSALLVYYADCPEFRGKPDIRQVTLKVLDEPERICFRAAAKGTTFLYTRSDATEDTEDRTCAWMLPPGGCMLRVADGQHEEVFTFFPDRVITNRSGRKTPLDCASDFVTLRITVGGEDFAVRYGDRTLIDGCGLFAAPAFQGRRGVHFGSGSSAATGEALWKSLRYRITEKR